MQFNLLKGVKKKTWKNVSSIQLSHATQEQLRISHSITFWRKHVVQFRRTNRIIYFHSLQITYVGCLRMPRLGRPKPCSFWHIPSQLTSKTKKIVFFEGNRFGCLVGSFHCCPFYLTTTINSRHEQSHGFYLLLCVFPLKRHTRGQKSAMSQNVRVLQKYGELFQTWTVFQLLFSVFSSQKFNHHFLVGDIFSSSYSPFFGQRKAQQKLQKPNQPQPTTTSVFVHIFRYLTGFSFPFLPKGRKVIRLGRLPFIPLVRRQLLFTLTKRTKLQGVDGKLSRVHGGLKLHKSWVLLYLLCSIVASVRKKCKKFIYPLQETPKRWYSDNSPVLGTYIADPRLG